MNLANLLLATHRHKEAESLMRRALQVFCNFTATTGHEHPNLRICVRGYQNVLSKMGNTKAGIRARLEAVAKPFGLGLT
jgi:hypothetical protein